MCVPGIYKHQKAGYPYQKKIGKKSTVSSISEGSHLAQLEEEGQEEAIKMLSMEQPENDNTFACTQFEKNHCKGK